MKLFEISFNYENLKIEKEYLEISIFSEHRKVKQNHRNFETFVFNFSIFMKLKLIFATCWRYINIWMKLLLVISNRWRQTRLTSTQILQRNWKNIRAAKEAQKSRIPNFMLFRKNMQSGGGKLISSGNYDFLECSVKYMYNREFRLIGTPSNRHFLRKIGPYFQALWRFTFSRQLGENNVLLVTKKNHVKFCIFSHILTPFFRTDPLLYHKLGNVEEDASLLNGRHCNSFSKIVFLPFVMVFQILVTYESS